MHRALLGRCAHGPGALRGDFHVTWGEAAEPSSPVTAPAPVEPGTVPLPWLPEDYGWGLLLLPESLPAPPALRGPLGPPLWREGESNRRADFSPRCVFDFVSSLSLAFLAVCAFLGSKRPVLSPYSVGTKPP